MRSLLKPDVIDKLNDLLRFMFKANSFGDLVAYQLESWGYHDASDIYHHQISHKFPVWADNVSDFMYNMGAMPVRKGFDGDDHEFESIEKIFKDNYQLFINLTDYIAQLIEEFEFDYKNRYVVINLEDVLQTIQPYVRVADTWMQKAEEYTKHDNLYKFDKDFHTFIKLSGD